MCAATRCCAASFQYASYAPAAPRWMVVVVTLGSIGIVISMWLAWVLLPQYVAQFDGISMSAQVPPPAKACATPVAVPRQTPKFVTFDGPAANAPDWSVVVARAPGTEVLSTPLVASPTRAVAASAVARIGRRLAADPRWVVSMGRYLPMEVSGGPHNLRHPADLR